MKFTDAIKLMRQGKRVRRKGWVKEECWLEQDNVLKSPLGRISLCFDNFIADDWEEYVEEDKWSLKGYYELDTLNIPKEHIKELKQKIIEDLIKEGFLMSEGSNITMVLDKRLGFK